MFLDFTFLLFCLCFCSLSTLLRKEILCKLHLGHLTRAVQQHGHEYFQSKCYYRIQWILFQTFMNSLVSLDLYHFIYQIELLVFFGLISAIKGRFYIVYCILFYWQKDKMLEFLKEFSKMKEFLNLIFPYVKAKML